MEWHAQEACFTVTFQQSSSSYHLFQSDNIEEILMQVGPDSPSDIANLRFPKGESVEDRADRLENIFPTRSTQSTWTQKRNQAG
jgi:hypothetical protein